MIYIKDQRFTVWKIEDKKTYALVNMSSSRKDKKTNKYHNSSWGFTRFFGSAYDQLSKLNVTEKTRILVKSGTLSREPYLDESGQTIYPKNTQFTVWDFEIYTPPAQQDRGMDTPPAVEEDPEQDLENQSEDEMPF